MNEFLKNRKLLTISTLVFVLLVAAGVVLSINLTSSSDNNFKTIKGLDQRLDEAVKSGRITPKEAQERQRRLTGDKYRSGAGRKPGIGPKDIDTRLNAAVENGELTQEEADAKREQLNTKRVELTEKKVEIAQKIDQRLNAAVENGELTQEEADTKREQLTNSNLSSEHRKKQGKFVKKNNPRNCCQMVCCQKNHGGNPSIRSDGGEWKTDKGTKGRKHKARDRGPQNHNAERQRR